MARRSARCCANRRRRARAAGVRAATVRVIPAGGPTARSCGRLRGGRPRRGSLLRVANHRAEPMATVRVSSGKLRVRGPAGQAGGGPDMRRGGLLGGPSGRRETGCPAGSGLRSPWPGPVPRRHSAVEGLRSVAGRSPKPHGARVGQQDGATGPGDAAAGPARPGPSGGFGRAMAPQSRSSRRVRRRRPGWAQHPCRSGPGRPAGCGTRRRVRPFGTGPDSPVIAATAPAPHVEGSRAGARRARLGPRHHRLRRMAVARTITGRPNPRKCPP